MTPKIFEREIKKLSSDLEIILLDGKNHVVKRYWLKQKAD